MVTPDFRRLALLTVAHEKAAADPVWAGGEPNIAPEAKRIASDPYVTYLEGVMGSPRRRENVFDLATGTRWAGLRGLKEQATTGLGEAAYLADAGLNPRNRKFRLGMKDAAKAYFSRASNVEKTFGSVMGPVEALKTLGVKDIFAAKGLAEDLTTWSKAFGKAAKTPAEQARARQILHAALSLNATVSGVGINKNKLKLWAAGVSPAARRAMRVPLVPVSTPRGTEMQRDPRAQLAAPALNPDLFPDNQAAAALMAKIGADEDREIAPEKLTGSYGTATFKEDPEDHLYHVERRHGVTVGMVKVAPRDKGARYHISNFWVKPGLRSQGIGTALMKKVLEAYGDCELSLDSEVFDKSPLTQEQLDAFYEKHGFIKGEGKAMTRAAGGPQEKSAAFLRGLLGRIAPGRLTAQPLKAAVKPLKAAVKPVGPSKNRVAARRAIASRLPALQKAFPAQAQRIDATIGRLGQRTMHERLQGKGFNPVQPPAAPGFGDISMGTPVMTPEQRLALFNRYLKAQGFRQAPGMTPAH